MERLVLKFRFGHIDPGGGRGAQGPDADRVTNSTRLSPQISCLVTAVLGIKDFTKEAVDVSALALKRKNR